VTQQPRFALITPARNARHTVGRTVAAVRGQQCRPAAWVIVDDGSQDDTAAVARSAADGADWIRVIGRPAGATPDFASKVHAFQAGLAEVSERSEPSERSGPSGLEVDFVGNLDADVTIAPDYFARLLGVFADRPRLGLAGGHVVEVVGQRRTPQRISPNSVAGAVQLFRREAFDAIGGLRPLRLGGEDSVAEILVRRNGWEVATVFELPVDHHGPILGGARGPVRGWYRRGQMFRGLGYDPLFQVVMGLYRAAAQPPYVLSGAALLCGYTSAALRRDPIALAGDEVAFLRAEQRQRLRRMVGLRASRRSRGG
jgi:poly-beta-1,6-N-acetyl-D-glucosamine synthase